MNDVLFLGNYSVGKSSIINYILGRDAAKTGICETTKIVCDYVRGNLRLIDSPGLNTKSGAIETLKSQIIRANSIFIVTTSATFKSLDYKKYYDYCAQIREYVDKRIYIVLNKIDELSDDPAVLHKIVRHFEKRKLCVYLLSCREHGCGDRFIEYIRNIEHENPFNFIRGELDVKLPRILPYNYYVTCLNKNCTWSHITYRGMKYHINKKCSAILQFEKKVHEKCEIIENHGFLTNVNLELIFLVTNSKIQNNDILKHKSVNPHLWFPHTVENCDNGIVCNIKHEPLSEIDYAVIMLCDIAYFVKFQDKIIDYHEVKLNPQKIQKYIEYFNTW
jgi:GTP-binding protein EngB required for normal cell division